MSMGVDHLRRGLHSSIRDRIEQSNDPKLQEALRSGDARKIKEAMPDVSVREIEEFLRYQSVELEVGVVKNHLIKADESTIPAPNYERDFLPMDSEVALDAADLQLLGMSKAALAGKAADNNAGGDPNSAMQSMVSQFADEQLELAEADIAEMQALDKKMSDHIFNVQMNIELTNKRDELRAELQRLIQLMKQGVINPEFVLIAMAKSQISERGILFTQTGKRVMRINEEMSVLAKEIGTKQDLGGIEVIKEEMRAEAMNMQMLVGNMQKLTHGINAIYDTTKSQLESINSTKLELIRHTAPQG